MKKYLLTVGVVWVLVALVIGVVIVTIPNKKETVKKTAGSGHVAQAMTNKNKASDSGKVELKLMAMKPEVKKLASGLPEESAKTTNVSIGLTAK